MGKSLRFAIDYRSMKKTAKATPIDDQGKMFIEAARELGCEESEERFDAALKRVATHKREDATSAKLKKSKKK